MTRLFPTALATLALLLSLGLSPILAQDSPALATSTTADGTTTTTSPEGVEVVTSPDGSETVTTGTGEATVTVTDGDATVIAPDADTVVNFNEGDAIDSILAKIQAAAASFLALVIAAIGTLLGQKAAALIKTFRVEQLLARAADYALNEVRGAMKGKALNFDVRNKVLAEALRFAVRNAPGLIKSMGGEQAAMDKLKARVPADESVGK